MWCENFLILIVLKKPRERLLSFKWEALISFLGEKERKNTSEGKKKRKKNCAFVRPSLELSPFTLSNTVYQRIELT